ncbi:efflux RND transporter periplasmic adaptor subunit [soil metagenome]
MIPIKFSSTSLRINMLAGTVIFLAACGSKQQQVQQGAPPPVSVTVQAVVTTDAVYYDEYPGLVTALNEIKLTAQVSGYITAVYFKDGDQVSKGQKLYSIDAQVYSANYQQALANLEVVETNMMKAQKDADRYHELDKNEAISKQQVDYADAALQASKKQVSAARANVAAVSSNVKFASIYAPFSGTIGISQVKTGTAVVAGQTILNTVSTDDPIAVDFAVGQKDIYRFVKLQQAGTQANDSTFSIAFGKDVYPYNGKINLIDRAVDPQTGTIKTRLEFKNDKKMLKAGMNTTVRVLNISSARSNIVPYKAVSEQLGEFFVYVVGDSSKVSQRKVSLGKQLGTEVIINDGLKEGEKIVVQGVQSLREGSVITTAPAPAAGSAPKK